MASFSAIICQRESRNHSRSTPSTSVSRPHGDAGSAATAARHRGLCATGRRAGANTDNQQGGRLRYRPASTGEVERRTLRNPHRRCIDEDPDSDACPLDKKAETAVRRISIRVILPSLNIRNKLLPENSWPISRHLSFHGTISGAILYRSPR